MNIHSNDVALKIVSISRSIFYASLVMGFGSALLFITNREWIEVFAGVLFVTGVILMAISWVTPALLIFFGIPWLAYAWFVGIKPFGRLVPWEQLPKKKKIAVYANSMISFLAVVAIIIANIISRGGK